MEKTITIKKRKIKLSNNNKWLKIYKQQFLHDITPDLIPLLTSAITLSEGAFVGGDGRMKVDPDILVNAVYNMAGFEIVTLFNITWAMAKAADESIEGPDEWIESLEEFPLDEVGPAIVELAAKGLVSSKNLRGLQDLKEILKPSILTQSMSQESVEG